MITDLNVRMLACNALLRCTARRGFRQPTDVSATEAQPKFSEGATRDGQARHADVEPH